MHFTVYLEVFGVVGCCV